MSGKNGGMLCMDHVQVGAFKEICQELMTGTDKWYTPVNDTDLLKGNQLNRRLFLF